MIVPGVTSQVLAAALADATGRDMAAVDRTRFPDGELLVEIESTPGDAAIVVASTTSSEAHMDLLLLQDALREAGVSDLTTVVPYLGYARQDTAFEAGQPVSVRPVARAIGAGTDRVITVNPHEDEVIEHFEVPATAVDAIGRLVDALPSDLTDPLFLAPDGAARGLAATLRESYGRGTSDHLEKTRHSERRVEVAPTDADGADRDVVLVDDIISTGSTMVEAVRSLRDRTPERILATCVHPLLVEDAYGRLSRAGVDGVYGTDTIEHPVSAVSVAPTIADALDR